MNSHEDRRKRSRHDGPTFMRYPVGGDLRAAAGRIGNTSLGRSIGDSMYTRPDYRWTVPEKVRHLSYMQDWDGYSWENYVATLDPSIVMIPNESASFYSGDEWTTRPATDPAYKDTHTIAVRDDITDLHEAHISNVEEKLTLLESGWNFVKENEDHHYEIYQNGDEAMVSFQHFGTPGFAGEIIPVLKNDVTSDGALTLRNITLGQTESINKHPYLSAEAEAAIRSDVSELQASGANVKFTGYSLGGFLAKHWGSKLGIDQEVVNAHVNPLNTFDETSAKTSFHTIATDETSFKYNVPNFNGRIPQDEHFTYPPEEGLAKMSFPFNPWGHHLTDSFRTTNPDIELGEIASRSGGKLMANAGGVVGAGVSAYSAVSDFRKGDYAMGVANASAVPAIVSGSNGAMIGAGGLIATTSYAEQAIDAAKEGDRGLEAWKGTEAGISGVSTIAGIATGSMAVAGAPLEALGAIDEGIQTYKDIKNHEYDHATAHGTAAVALAAGAGLAFETAGLSLVVGGIVAGVAEISDAIGRRRYRKRMAREEAARVSEKFDKDEQRHENFFNDTHTGERQYHLPPGSHWEQIGEKFTVVKDEPYVHHRTPGGEYQRRDTQVYRHGHRMPPTPPNHNPATHGPHSVA